MFNPQDSCYDNTLSDRGKKEVYDWMQRLNKKGPFFLYSTKIDQDGSSYVVIWVDKGKVKIGGLQDGMYCRYGIGTRATLSSGSALGLWKSSPNAIDQHQLDAMIMVWNAKTKAEVNLPEFKLETLKNLVH